MVALFVICNHDSTFSKSINNHDIENEWNHDKMTKLSHCLGWKKSLCSFTHETSEVYI